VPAQQRRQSRDIAQARIQRCRIRYVAFKPATAAHNGRDTAQNFANAGGQLFEIAAEARG
jgi:hypothetical protein